MSKTQSADQEGVIATYRYTIIPTGKKEERSVSLVIYTKVDERVVRQKGLIGKVDSIELARLTCVNDFMERLEELYGASVER